MSWAEVKHALNSTLGTDEFIPLSKRQDKFIDSSNKSLDRYYSFPKYAIEDVDMGIYKDVVDFSLSYSSSSSYVSMGLYEDFTAECRYICVRILMKTSASSSSTYNMFMIFKKPFDETRSLELLGVFKSSQISYFYYWYVDEKNKRFILNQNYIYMGTLGHPDVVELTRISSAPSSGDSFAFFRKDGVLYPTWYRSNDVQYLIYDPVNNIINNSFGTALSREPTMVSSYSTSHGYSYNGDTLIATTYEDRYSESNTGRVQYVCNYTFTGTALNESDVYVSSYDSSNINANDTETLPMYDFVGVSNNGTLVTYYYYPSNKNSPCYQQRSIFDNSNSSGFYKDLVYIKRTDEYLANKMTRSRINSSGNIMYLTSEMDDYAANEDFKNFKIESIIWEDKKLKLAHGMLFTQRNITSVQKIYLYKGQKISKTLTYVPSGIIEKENYFLVQKDGFYDLIYDDYLNLF